MPIRARFARLGGRVSVERLAWAFIGCLFVFVIAFGSHRGSATAGARLELPDLGAAAVGLYSAVVGIAAIGFALLVYLVVAGGIGRRKKDEEQRVEFPIPWLAKVVAWVVVLLLCGGLAALIVLWRGESTSAPAPFVPVSVSTTVETESVSSPAGSWGGKQPMYWWLLAGVCVAGVVGIAAAVFLLRGDRLRAEETALPDNQVYARRIIESSLEDISAEPDPRRAVIRAYVNLEQALSRRGLGRKPSEAPLEYLGRWLAGLGVSHPAAERLTWLFQRARFSPHPVGPEMKQEAFAALVAIREELLGERGS
ncbi:MAG: DUF4129 domain-containing protein [Thermoleophilia bacterium]|nr:DUF4129 domain-containing protein [Thermoleophilia bacterium]